MQNNCFNTRGIKNIESIIIPLITFKLNYDENRETDFHIRKNIFQSNKENITLQIYQSSIFWEFCMIRILLAESNLIIPSLKAQKKKKIN